MHNALANVDVRRFLDNLWEGVYVVASDRRIIHWNKAAEEITGYTAAEVVGKRCGKCLLSHHTESTTLCEVGCPLDATLHDGQVREAQVFLTHKSGISIPVYVRTQPFRGSLGNIIGAFEIFRTVNTADEATAILCDLEKKARTDLLTEAARRDYGDMVLENALSAFSSRALVFGLLLVDLDKFKTINDRYGHPAGDYVLRRVARGIQKRLRSSDLLIRWGGDEFMIIYPHVNADTLNALGTKICGLIRESSYPFEGKELPVSVSVGGAMPQPGDSKGSLLIRLDKNLYISKHNNKNCSTVL